MDDKNKKVSNFYCNQFRVKQKTNRDYYLYYAQASYYEIISHKKTMVYLVFISSGINILASHAMKTGVNAVSRIKEAKHTRNTRHHQIYSVVLVN